MSAANKLSPQELNKVIAAAKDQYRHFIEQLNNLGQYATVLNNFLPKIKAGDKFEANLVVELVIEAVRDPSVSCEVKYRALHVLKDCMQTNHGSIGIAVAERHLPTIMTVLKNAQASGGATLFKQSPTPDDKKFSQKSFQLLGICIQAWSDMYSSIDAYMDAFMELLQGNFDLNSDAEYNTSLAAGSTPPPNVSGGPQGRSTGPTVTPPPPVDNSRNSRVGGGVSDPQGLQALKENRTLMNDLIIENDKLEDFAIDSAKEYEQVYNQVVTKIGGPQAIEAADSGLKYELLYAGEFLKVFEEFSTMTVTFDQLKTAVKNGIDKKVRDKLEGRVPPSPGPTARGLPDNSGIARSNTPQGLPVQRSDMPTIHSNNPFANALSGGPPDRDNSMLDHSGLGNVNYDQHRGNPSGGGPSHSQMSVGMNGQQGQPNSDLMHKISSLEHQLVQQRQLVDDLKKINDGQKDMIDRLKQDKSNLESELDREKRKAREMAHSGPADHKDEIQRLQQANMALESEILNLNKENAKLFEATQANLAKLSGNSDGGQSLRQKVAQLTAENGYLKDQLGSGSLKGASSNLGAGTDQEVYQLKQKINKLEFENANLRDQSVLSANQEVAALQTEIRKLKTDALLEVKALKSKLIVAEEKANTLMNQYKDRISSGYSTEAQKPAAIFDSKKFLQELYSTSGSHHDRDTFTAHDYSNRLGGLVQPTYLTSGLVTALKEQDQAVLQGYIQPVGRSRSPIYDTHRYGTTTPSYTYPSGLPTSEHVVHYRLGKSPVAVPAGTSGVTSRPTSISRPSYDPSSGGVDMRASYVSTVSIPLNMGSLEGIPHSVPNYNQGQTRSVSRGRPSTGMEGFSTQYSQRVAGVYNTTRAEDRSGRRVSRVDGTSPHQVRDSYVSIYGPQETRPHTSRSPSTLGPSQTFLAEFSRKIKDLQ